MDETELYRMKKLGDRMARGHWPIEAFTLVDVPERLDQQSLAEEISAFVKGSGGFGGNGPMIQMDVPFTYTSKLAGRPIQVAMKSSFIRDIQNKITEHASQQQPRGPLN